MKLKFLGATGTVTGSKYLLTSNNTSVLVDCGLFQGLKSYRLKNWEALPIDVSKISAVVLTHAHLDHSGYIPKLIKEGFTGKIYCTPSTRDLCQILLVDSGHLLEEESKYANKMGYSKHKPAEALYNAEEAKSSLKNFEVVDYEKPFKLNGDITFTFRNAGHILGSANVTFSDGYTSICFSGDVGRQNDTLLHSPVAPGSVDYLVVESTYGNRIHPKEDPLQQLEDVITRTAKRGGVLVIPAFAVGRTQHILYYLHELLEAKRIPALPIYINSPMATKATGVYTNSPEAQKISLEKIKAVNQTAKYIQTVQESEALGFLTMPSIILSASGMATGGRVVHHIKSYAPHKKNTLMFVGFQAAGTRGRSIVTGSKTVKIHGQDIPINAEVVNLESLSAHGDKEEILHWLKSFPAPPRKTFITHGEPKAAEAFCEFLSDSLGWTCEVPEEFNEVDL